MSSLRLIVGVLLLGVFLSRSTVRAQSTPSDSYANAPLISSASFQAQGQLSGATSEPGEAAHAGAAALRSRWLRFAPPSDGYLGMSTPRIRNLRIAIYEETAAAGLEPRLARALDSADVYLGVPVAAGKTYAVALDDDGVGAGAFNLLFTLSSIYLKVTPSTPNLSAPAVVTVEAVSSDPSLSVLGYSLNAGGVAVGGRTEPPWILTYTNEVGGSVILGGTVGVLGYNVPLASAPIQLRFIPPNDAFATASVIPPDAGLVTVSGDALLATTELGEPPFPTGGIHRSLWWHWTPSYEALTRVRGSGLFQVYRGTALDPLALVASGSPVGVSFNAERGVSYYFRCDLPGNNPATGAVSLTLDRFVLNPVPRTPLAWETNALGPSLVGRGGSTMEVGVEVLNPAESFSSVRLIRVDDPGAPPLAESFSAPHVLRAEAPDGEAILVRLQGTNTLGQSRLGTPFQWIGRPVNDEMAGATPLSPEPWGSVALTPRLTWAGNESGEPVIPGAIGDRTVWFRWTAPTDATAYLDIPSTPAALWAAAYGGATSVELQRLAIASNQGDPGPRLAFSASAGETYWIAVAGPEDAGVPFSFGQVPVRATAEPDTVPLGGALQLRATATGGSPGPFRIVFREGDTEIARVDPAPGGASWTPTGPGLHRLAATLESDGLILRLPDLEIRVTPANDSRSTALEVTTNSGEILWMEGSLTLSTLEPGEPTAFPPGSGTVWFRWTALESGAFQIRQVRGSAQVRAQLFSGPDGNSLQSVTTFPDLDLPAPVVLTAGTHYWVAVSSADSNAGSFAFALGPAPANDDLAKVTVLSGEFAEIRAANVFATTEPGEVTAPALAPFQGRGTVWWRWTAPEFGDATFALADGDCNTIVGVFTGGSMEALVPVVPVEARNIVGAPHPEVTYAGIVQFRARRGVTYTFGAAGFDPGTGPVLGRMIGTFRFSPNPALRNDLFIDRIPVTGTDVRVQGDSSGAELEPGEPSAQYGLFNSLWWSYTAERAGAVQVSIQSLTSPIYLLAFVGNSLETLERREIGGDIYLEAGQQLQLAAGGTGGAYEIRIHFFEPRPPSTNDSFAGRSALELPVQDIAGNLHGATAEPGEPIAPPAGGGSLWWGITPPQDGILELKLTLANFGAYPQLFRGDSLGTLTGPLPYEDPSTIGWRLTAGIPYALRLASSYGEPSEFHMITRFYPRPENDDFANRIRIETRDVAIRAWMFEGSVESGEPLPSATSRQTLWWSWAAPENGRIELPNYDPSQFPLAVYTGPDLAHLSRVPLRMFFSDTASGLSIPVLNGTVYHLQVGGEGGASRFVPLDGVFRPLGAAIADRFDQPMPMEGVQIHSRSSAMGATREPGEPFHSGNPDGASIWWRWQAPHRGRVELRQEGGTLSGATLAVYQGNTVDALQKVAQGIGTLSFSANAGETYRIVGEVPGGSVGDIGFHLFLNAPPGGVIPMPGNLVKNPSFEDLENGSPILDWTAPLGFTGVVGASPSESALEGHNFVILSGNRVEQLLPTEAGRNYRLRLAVAASDQAGPVRMKIRVGDQQLDPVEFEAGTTPRFWHWTDQEFTATGPSLLSIESTGVRAGLDGISVIWLNEPPRFLTPPGSLSTFAGRPVAVTAGVQGSGPLELAWYRVGGIEPVFRGRVLRWEAISPGDAGEYFLRATNPWGSIESQAFRVTVEPALSPQIVVQPESDAVIPGQFIALGVVAIGTPPLEYQWSHDGKEILGATNRILSIASVTDSDLGEYHVVVRNASERVTSLPAVLFRAATSPSGGARIAFSAWSPIASDGVEIPVTDLDGVTLLSGDRFVAQLYTGSSETELRPVGAPRPFLTGFYEGYWAPEILTLPHVAPGSAYVAQVRAWDATAGATYEEARALGGRFGRSALHAVPASDPDPGLVTGLHGLAGFSLSAGLPEFAVGRIQFEGTAPDGTLSWRLTGTPGFRYLLEKREEGSHWKPDRIFENVQGSVVFSTPITEDASVLYRARILD